jgi:hypothetical protein
MAPAGQTGAAYCRCRAARRLCRAAQLCRPATLATPLQRPAVGDDARAVWLPNQGKPMQARAASSLRRPASQPPALSNCAGPGASIRVGMAAPAAQRNREADRQGAGSQAAVRRPRKGRPRARAHAPVARPSAASLHTAPKRRVRCTAHSHRPPACTGCHAAAWLGCPADPHGSTRQALGAGAADAAHAPRVAVAELPAHTAVPGAGVCGARAT